MHCIQSSTTTKHGSVMYCVYVLLILEENSLRCLEEPSQSRLSFPWHVLRLGAAFQEGVCLYLFFFLYGIMFH